MTKKTSSKYQMESDETITSTIKWIRSHYISLVKDVQKTALSVVQKPVVMWAGSDVKHASIHIPTIYGLYMVSDYNNQIGMVKLTSEGIVADSFELDTPTKNPHVFFMDQYRDEWLDRLKLFYQMNLRRGILTPSLSSISELYSGPLEYSKLMTKAEQMRAIPLDESLSESDERRSNIKSLVEQGNDLLSDKTAQLSFLIWLGSTLPVHIIVDHNIAGNLLKPNGMGSILMPADEDIIIRFLEICDRSINQFSNLQGFQNVEIPIYHPQNDTSYSDAITAQLENAQVQVTQLQNLLEAHPEEADPERTKILKKLKKLAPVLKYHQECILKGGSAFNLFVFDRSDVNKRVSSPDICQIMTVSRPSRKLRKAIVFQSFKAMYNTYLESGILLRMVGGIEATMVDAMAGLNSIQIEQAIKISIQQKVLSTLKEGKTKVVELISSDFEATRKALVKKEYLELVDETLTFSDIAGRSTSKKH